MPVSAPHTGTRGGQRVGWGGMYKREKKRKGRVAGTQVTVKKRRAS